MKRAIKQARRLRSQRYGKSLIETLVMISILSIILGLSSTSLATLFRLRYFIMRDAEQAASLDRLATRLRTDAHAAASVAMSDDCVLTFADGRTIRYAFAAPRITREVRENEIVVHRDSFLLPRHTVVEFSAQSGKSDRLMRLDIKPATTNLPPRELPRSAVIEAVVGLHGAIAKAEGQR